jgi:hypothetical protein
MDALAFIMIGCTVAALTGITFMELRKIRKFLERRQVSRGLNQQVHVDTSHNAA